MIPVKNWFSVFIPVLAGICALLSGCAAEPEKEMAPVVRPVKFFEINAAAGADRLEYSGKIKAVQEVTMAFELPGKIKKFPVKEGQEVKKGTILCRLDARDHQITFDAKAADLDAAKAQYERAKALYKHNTISRRDMDLAKRNFEVARAGVNAAHKALEDSVLRAPFSGMIAKTLVENYQNIQAKQPILILQDNSALEVVVDIPEKDFTALEKATSLEDLTELSTPEVMVSSLPDQRFAARFKEAAATADPVTRTFEVTLGFTPSSRFLILPGMTARLSIWKHTTAAPDQVMIPARAVFSDDNGRAMVWRIDPATLKVKRHGIEVSEMSGSDIRVITGLKPGDIIAVSGVHQLREGRTVEPYKPL